MTAYANQVSTPEGGDLPLYIMLSKINYLHLNNCLVNK